MGVEDAGDRHFELSSLLEPGCDSLNARCRNLSEQKEKTTEAKSLVRQIAVLRLTFV